MKRVRSRALITLCIAALLLLGLILFSVRYVTQGRDWVGFFGSTYFENGAIYDRNGVLLYDGQTGDYAESKTVRQATMHLVGDRNIATSLRNVMGGRLSGYNLVTGTAFGGHDLYLSIDADLNKTAYDALKGRKGVVAMYNYKTGEILCLVSAPSFDPKYPPSASALEEPRYEGVYLNRFFSSAFTPGSIFKIVTTAAVLERKADLDSWRFTCTGHLEVGGQTITCPSVHGSDLTLGQAFARSCNCAYAQLAEDLGGARLKTYAQQGGLLSSVEISGIATATGDFVTGEAGSADLGWSGSGQYHDMINPATFLMMVGGIANGGTTVTPTLLHKETISDSKVPGALGEGKSRQGIWKPETCQSLREMMRNNVVETYGQKQFGDLPVCAKSGTAEVGSGAPHAWFVGFVDDTKTPLAFLVLVENGGSGASVAGSIAAKLLREAAAP